MKDHAFTYKMKVRDYELDVQGIVNNANYLHYYEVARHEFLESCNVSFMKAHECGIDPVVSSIEIKYKKSLVSGDEFYVTVDLEKKGVRYYFSQKIIKISNGEICSEGMIEVVCTQNGRVIKPEYFDDVFSKYLS